mmetsp:Transcript_3722/g.4264  ORF Transcript_3722/g.4264 Transcript_3722/m.4264 type:complete len:106 (+) Transcript_3722:24-341(+)
MRISFAVMALSAAIIENAYGVPLDNMNYYAPGELAQIAQEEGGKAGQANVVVIDQSRSAFGGGNLAGPHIMNSVSNALARAFGSNPSAGPAPSAAQTAAEEIAEE